MKKRYFSSLLLGLLALGMNAQTQYTILEDLTSKISNSDFSTDTPVDATIRTYDYDIPDQLGKGAGGEGYYGQQEINGWTAANPSDNTWMAKDTRTDGSNARAAGPFAYINLEEGSTIGLGGDYFAPALEDGLTTNALGMVAVWGADLKYTQDITLPAGAYMLIVKVQNVAGTGTLTKNNFGFIASDGTAYTSTTMSYPEIQTWVEDSIFIRLKEDTEGQLCMGYGFAAGSGSAPHLFIDNIKLFSIDPAPLDKAQVDALKEELLKVIVDGEDLGADTSAAQEVYDNEAATLEEVQAAIDSQLALNEEKKTDLSEFFITNPHFTMNDPVEGGICTYDYDCEKNNIATTNYSMLPLQGWTATKTDNGVAAGVYSIGSQAFLGGNTFFPPTTMSDGSTEGKVLGFVSCWGFTAAYKQAVTIPAGKYQLTISFYNSGGKNAIAKNLMGFVADDGTEYLGETTTFPEGKWISETIKFELEEETEGYFTMGYTAANTGSANMPHFFIDGISLVYSGELEIDPSLFALQAVVNQGYAQLNETSDFYVDLYEKFQAELEKGSELVSSQSADAEANNAATKTIQGLLTEVKENVEAYKNLQDFFNTDLKDAIYKYSSLESLASKLETMEEAVDEALSDYIWDTAKINETIAQLDPMLKEEIQKAWDAAIASGEKLEQDLDITPLFEQMAYTFSTTAASAANVPDKEWKYGDASNFKTQYGTAEVWNQSPFTVSRTMADMPAGRYTITTKAFYRTANNITNLSTYNVEDQRAFLFAGRSKTALTNVAALASQEAIEGWAEVKDAEEVVLAYVPNSQQAAYELFENADYTEAVLKTASTSLVEAGDLIFGVTADAMETDSWAVWYSFTISYNAVDESDVLNELTILVQDAQELRDASDDSEYISYITEATGRLNNAISDGENALTTQTMDDMKAAINTIVAAMDYAKKGADLVQQFSDLYQPYSDLMAQYEYASFDERLQELLDKAGDETATYESNEELEGYIAEMPMAWFNYVLGQDLESAEEQNPVDITGVILNPTFEGNANNWTIAALAEDGKIGQNQGFQNNNEYTSEDQSIIISQFIEAWRPTTAEAPLSNGLISQELLGALPAGYYVLEVDGFATTQAEAMPEEGLFGTYLYAENADKSYVSSMCIDVTGAQPKHFTMAFYSDGVNKTKVGLFVKDTNATWLVADNFMLSYIGTTAPEETKVGADGISKVATSSRVEAIYSLSGARKNTLTRGINIVKTADGAIRKVLVK